jgi:hypothetical protein
MDIGTVNSQYITWLYVAEPGNRSYKMVIEGTNRTIIKQEMVIKTVTSPQ